MSERVSGNELAKRLGLTERAVRKHVLRGLYRRGADGKFDFEKCRALWQANRDPDSAIRGLAGGAAVTKQPADDTLRLPETSLSKARTAHAALSAQRQKLLLDKERGELIKSEDAFAACRAVVSVVCERIDGAAAQIAARVVGLSRVEAEKVAREILTGVRAEISKLGEAVQEVSRAS